MRLTKGTEDLTYVKQGRWTPYLVIFGYVKTTVGNSRKEVVDNPSLQGGIEREQGSHKISYKKVRENTQNVQCRVKKETKKRRARIFKTDKETREERVESVRRTKTERLTV